LWLGSDYHPRREPILGVDISLPYCLTRAAYGNTFIWLPYPFQKKKFAYVPACWLADQKEYVTITYSFTYLACFKGYVKNMVWPQIGSCLGCMESSWSPWSFSGVYMESMWNYLQISQEPYWTPWTIPGVLLDSIGLHFGVHSDSSRTISGLHMEFRKLQLELAINGNSRYVWLKNIISIWT